MEDLRENPLVIETTRERDRISAFIGTSLKSLKRDGAVVGLSGGIDSAVAVALCVESLGQDKVIGLLLPERESNPMSLEYAQKHAARLGIRYECIDITPVLEKIGTYIKRDEVIRSMFPSYRPDDKIKLSLPADLLARDALNIYSLSIIRGEDLVFRSRLTKEQLGSIVAATNTKQRTRMLHLYYWAEKHNYIVCGTTNRSELVQGFFVKYGDGGVDIEPLAHLYKTQVYQLAAALDVPQEIILRPPSPDTFSKAVSDEEFYFRMPYDRLDPLLWAWERKLTPAEAGKILGLSEDQVIRVFRDFAAKYRSAQHLLMIPPALDILPSGGLP
ncbi:MAG: NAD(+) synthase [Deltaproteobacteria bacterium]|nr:NAD(+) synthase [Deltaproteobacteria bacterium]